MCDTDNMQVAVVDVFFDDSHVSSALFINGLSVRTADYLSHESSQSLMDLGKMTALSLGLDFQVFRVDVKVGWKWGEVRESLIGAGRLMAPRQHNLTWMSAFYRCPSCFNEWSHVDQLAQAEICRGVGCEGQTVEPYFTGGPSPLNSRDEVVRLEALARHQRVYPNADEVGPYEVEVERVASRTACISVEAAGLADAELAALDKAGDHAFSSESTADYEVVSVSRSMTHSRSGKNGIEIVES